ncbi:MAG: hypothetical protein K0R71_1858 [Bacillales bacterium]|jgi:hypothetical protein|nr:hypothetical protein [Bacillales bacterium]
MSERPKTSRGSSSNPWQPKNPSHHSKEKANLCAFIDGEIGIEAKVKVKPEVSIGEVKIECLESGIEPCSKHEHSSEECTVYINQLVRIKIPIHIRAEVKAEECGVICHPCIDESPDCS